VRADDRAHLAGIDPQEDAGHRGEAAIAHGDGVELEEGHRYARWYPSRNAGQRRASRLTSPRGRNRSTPMMRAESTSSCTPGKLRKRSGVGGRTMDPSTERASVALP